MFVPFDQNLNSEIEEKFNHLAKEVERQGRRVVALERARFWLGMFVSLNFLMHALPAIVDAIY